MRINKTKVELIMADKDITKKEVCEKANNMPYATLNNAMKGKEITIQTCGRIARALEVKSKDIIQD